MKAKPKGIGQELGMDPAEMRARNMSPFHPGKHAAQMDPGIGRHQNPEAHHPGRMPKPMMAKVPALEWHSRKGPK